MFYGIEISRILQKKQQLRYVLKHKLINPENVKISTEADILVDCSALSL